MNGSKRALDSLRTTKARKAEVVSAALAYIERTSPAAADGAGRAAS